MRAGRAIADSLSVPLTTSFAGGQTLWWPPATAEPPKVVVLFIPGNPGLSNYYIDFLHSIYSSLSRVEVLAVSHRGHARFPPVGTNRVWGDNVTNATHAAKAYGTSLADQVRHKIAALDAIRSQYPRETGTKVVLIGHSIGAWIATEVVKAREDEVDAVHALFPTLEWIGRTPNATKIKMLANTIVMDLILPLPLLVLSLIPLWALVWVIRAITGQPKPAALATAELLTTRGAVYNSLTMAKEEFATVKVLSQETVDKVGKLTSPSRGGKYRSYWASGESDSWAPGWIRSQVETQLALHRDGKEKRPMRTRSFSLSEYRSSPTLLTGLRNAKATRKPTGEIVIEAPIEDPPTDNADEGASRPTTRYNATSTHCKIGMPHTFCIHHSNHMAKIVANWIRHDHLEAS